MKTIYCIRHAITNAHVASRTNSTLGFFDVELNQQGRQDAKILAEQLKNLGIQGILSSDQKSSAETAMIFSDILNVPVYFSDIFRERNQGEYCGVELKTLKEKNKNFNITTEGKGRESLKDFINRTKAGFKRITNDFNWESCILISHKGFLQTMTMTCLNIKPSNWYLCEVRIWVCENGKWKQKETINLF